MSRSRIIARRERRGDARYRTAISVLLLASLLALALPCLALGQVAARDLPRHAVLGAGDVVSDAPKATRAVTGWVTQRAIRAGQPLVPPAVAPPPLVRRGAAVTVVYDDGAVRVSRRGNALRDAARDEPCPVRIAADEPGRTHQVVTGRAVRPGVVLIGPARHSPSQEHPQ